MMYEHGRAHKQDGCLWDTYGHREMESTLVLTHNYLKFAQYGRHTASSSLAVVAMLVGELLWLPSASTTSLWLGRLGLRSVDPVEALVQGGWMRGGDRSPPEIMEN